jgi:hypothetical protein
VEAGVISAVGLVVVVGCHPYSEMDAFDAYEDRLDRRDRTGIHSASSSPARLLGIAVINGAIAVVSGVPALALLGAGPFGVVLPSFGVFVLLAAPILIVLALATAGVSLICVLATAVRLAKRPPRLSSRSNGGSP